MFKLIGPFPLVEEFKQNHIVFRGTRRLAEVFTDNAGNIDDKETSRHEYRGKQSGSQVFQGTVLDFVLQMDDPWNSQFALMVTHARNFTTMMLNSRGTSGWTINYNIPIWAIGPIDTSYFKRSDFSINIYDNTTVWSDLYHEMGHLIQERIYDLESPGGTHFFNTVLGRAPNDVVSTDKAARLAMSEGWADYCGALAHQFYPRIVDTKYHAVLEDERGHDHVWRGLAASQPPSNVGLDNNGELIENNIASILFRGGPYSTGDYLRILKDSEPQTFHDFFEGALELQRQGNAVRDRFMTHVEQHGIVYARARFADHLAPFNETPPGPQPEPANAALLRDSWHVRGAVTSDLVPMSSALLHSTTTDEVAAIRLVYKVANDAGNDSAQPASQWQFSSDKGVKEKDGVFTETWDTAKNTPDGPYDLAAQARSDLNKIHWDSLYPAFDGDANLLGIDSDEEYLKSIGVWFSHVSDYTITPIGLARGRIHVDNTPPRIVPNSVFPPPNP